MEETGRASHGFGIEVRLHLPGSAAHTAFEKLAAHLFTSGGRLLKRTPIGPYGLANLPVPAGAGRADLLLMIGPALDGNVSPMVLRAHRPLERLLEPAGEGRVQSVSLEVSKETLRGWLNAQCRVRGLLIGRTAISGEEIEAPVAGAMVRIYRLPSPAEVVARLPGAALENLRAILGGWGVLEEGGAGGVPVSGLLGNLDRALRIELLSAALSPDAAAFRALLIEQAPGLREVLGRLLASCRPMGLDLHLAAVARSDSEGRFASTFRNPSSREGAPDLYFSANQPLPGGLSLSLYRPRPVNRHIHWQYRSGDEVTLYCRNHLFRAPHRLKGAAGWLIGASGGAPSRRFQPAVPA